MSVLVWIIIMFPLIFLKYVSVCGLLLFYFGTVPSNFLICHTVLLICQSVVWIIIILFCFCSLLMMSVCVELLFCVATVPSN